jgi:hypothetical protein
MSSLECEQSNHEHGLPTSMDCDSCKGQKTKLRLGVVVHAYNLSTQQPKAGGTRVETCLSCIGRSCLKNKKAKLQLQI